MSAEQQHPGSALLGHLERRPILPRVQDHTALASSPDTIPGPDSARRLRSCVACKVSKVRCRRDGNRPADACGRCASTGRECIVTARAKNKRPRRNISTVASLESKVDALVAALRVTQAGGGENGRLESSLGPMPDTDAQSMHQTLRRDMRVDDDADRAASSSNPGTYDHATRKKVLQAEHQYSLAFFMPIAIDRDKDLQKDVIGQGLISVEEAVGCFIRFRDVMLPHFPVVVFLPGTTATIVRRTRPVLFLAILAAASGTLGEGLRKLLVEELMRNFASRIIMKGDKCLDLVQALQVCAIWYFPPERFDEVQSYQLFHLAAIMATELDFGRACRSNTSRLSLLKEGDLGRSPLGPSRPKESESECQRAWLSCYIVCGIAFMMTRRPNLMRWTPYMDECIQALECPGTAVKSDLYLCQWVRAQRIAEEVGQQFFMDDPSANIDISDLSVIYILRGYEQQIDQWKAQIPPDILRPTLQIEASILNLYLHEIYLYDGHNIKEFASPFMGESTATPGEIKPRTLNAAHRKALAICIASVRNVFDIFLSFDTETLCSVPILYYIRTAYTAFAMIKIHFAAGRLDNDLLAMMEEDLNVEFYIDKLLKSLEEVSRARKLRVAAIFRLILLMLRTWFRKQKFQTGPDFVHVRRNDTIFHTVLQTADDINANGSVHSGSVLGYNARVHETGVASSFFHVVPTAGNDVPADVNTWPLEQDEETLPWDEFDYESFLDTDNAMLLQSVLERLGGMVG